MSAPIQSPHVAHVTDVDKNEDGHFRTWSWSSSEGTTCRPCTMQRDHARQRLRTPIALDYTLQMSAGLEAAHDAWCGAPRSQAGQRLRGAGTPRGPLVKLLDFGIAKLRSSKEFQVVGLTRPGVMMGTPEYMAPEQAYSADTVDARADVYSVGAMLYEMLVGVRPAQGDDAQQIAAFIWGGKSRRSIKSIRPFRKGLRRSCIARWPPIPKNAFQPRPRYATRFSRIAVRSRWRGSSSDSRSGRRRGSHTSAGAQR